MLKIIGGLYVDGIRLAPGIFRAAPWMDPSWGMKRHVIRLARNDGDDKPRDCAHHTRYLVNVYKKRWKITIVNGKTEGKPWENHGKMVIYMEHHHAMGTFTN